MSILKARAFKLLSGSVVGLTLSVGIASADPIGHVFVIVLENQSYATTFGAASQSPYLAQTLSKKGALLTQYYGIGHASLDNYIAMISGQPPNEDTQRDCGIYSNFVLQSERLDAKGRVIGHGCVYPTIVPTLPDQLEKAGFTWRGYMEDMGNISTREAATCGHSTLGTKETLNRAVVGDQYAAKHDPFIYFHSIIDGRSRCNDHVVVLDKLSSDLGDLAATPNFAYITPNLCNDGHDSPCVDGRPGGLKSMDAFLRQWVPMILNSLAFQKDGLLVITFDEADSANPAQDSLACCGEEPLPGAAFPPGGSGPGGGRIGAVLLSPFIKAGTISNVAYNHFSLLRSVEDIFCLSHLAGAGGHRVTSFGGDIFASAGDIAHRCNK